MNPIATVIARSGILPQDILDQMRRWGLPVPETTGPNLTKAEDVVASIEFAMQSEGLVLTRETDLEVLSQFLNTQKQGVLRIVADDDQYVDIVCSIGVTPMGGYIIPHRGDTIADLLVNGKTCVIMGGKKVFFQDARELFYGEHKAFIVCIPSTVEDA